MSYEPMTSLLWQMALAKEGWAIDVGANEGHFAAIAAQAGKQVMAFEPRSSAFQELTNTRAKHPGVFLTYKQAVSNFVGKSTLYFATERKYTASLKPLRWRTSSEIVDTVTLDAYQPSAVSVIKIDVEGAEPEVIWGAHRIITEDKPTLFVEVLSDAIGADIEEALPISYDFYRIYEDEMRVEPQNYLSVREGWGNFMLLPHSRN